MPVAYQLIYAALREYMVNGEIMKKNTRVVVLGASPKRQRFSNQALHLLQKHGYMVIPVHPTMDVIESIAVVSTLEQITEAVDTLTLYLSADKGEKLVDAIIKLKPRRVIFNPGTRSEKLLNALKNEGIICIEDCTLVMLNSGTF
jgi:hypothetical protein